MSKQSERKRRESVRAKLNARLLHQNSKQNHQDEGASDDGSCIGPEESARKGHFSAPALDAYGSLIFVVIGVAFHIAGGWFHIIAFFFDFLAVVCGLTIITHHVGKNFKLFGLGYWLSIIFVLFMFVSLAFYVVKKETSKGNGNEPDLAFPKFSEEVNSVLITEGGNSYNFPGSVLRSGKVRIFDGNGTGVWIHEVDGAIIVDAVLIADSDTNKNVSIISNRLLNKPAEFDMNADSAAMEVVNGHGDVVFSLDYRSRTHIALQGFFIGRDGEGVYLNGLGMIFAPPNLAGVSNVVVGAGQKWVPIQPIFRHPATRFPGQRVE